MIKKICFYNIIIIYHYSHIPVLYRVVIRSI